MKQRSKSIGILQFQKQIKKGNLEEDKGSSFIPFLRERDLGKLISSSSNLKKQKVTHDINFKNFKQIYQRQSKLEQFMYSKITRNSQQNDLIKDKGWIKNTLINNFKTHHQYQKFTQSERKTRKCCSKQVQKPFGKKNTFQKIDRQMYKKMEKNAPNNIDNPEITQLFNNYIMVCQFNENIRRQQLVKK